MSEIDREDAWLERVKKQMDQIHTIDWENYKIKDTFKEKLVPPISPTKINMGLLKSRVSQYLCQNCCSHRIIRTSKTAPGCVDILQISASCSNEDVAVPPLKKKDQLWFSMHTFVCTCKRKALIVETDKFSDLVYTKDANNYDPEMGFTEYTDSLLVCNVRVL